jgi:hypothetical protein
VGLKSDGTIVAWGNTGAIPAPNEGFIAVAAGYFHNLGLRSDGWIVAWGENSFGQCNVPGAIGGYVAVAAGEYHSLGIKSDGRILVWGDNANDQFNVPAPNEGFVAVAAGWTHSLGLKNDGAIVAWGHNVVGQCNVPLPNEGFVAVAAGMNHSLGLRSSSTTDVEEPGPVDVPGVARIEILSLSPNPFNPSTEIFFETSLFGHVSLEVYDVSGRRVRTVDLGYVGPGRHRAQWDGRDVSGVNLVSGVYFLSLHGIAGDSRSVKAVLVR